MQKNDPRNKVELGMDEGRWRGEGGVKKLKHTFEVGAFFSWLCFFTVHVVANEEMINNCRKIANLQTKSGITRVEKINNNHKCNIGTTKLTVSNLADSKFYLSHFGLKHLFFTSRVILCVNIQKLT